MSRLLVFQHVAAEPLGSLDPLIRRRGHRIRFVNFERDPDARPSIDRYRGLVVLGGPMNVDDQARHPHLRTELRVIEDALKQDKPVLGICLGAQLLAHAHGGEVRKLARRHLDWLPLVPLPAAEGDPVLGSLPPGAAGVHWNEDGFALPAEAVELLRSPAGTGEGFRIGERSWGVQFHPELDGPAIDDWYVDWHTALESAGVAEEDARAADREHLPGQRALSEAIFGGFARVVASVRG
jgi:GMP synthase (glutamine-hydrolysing)